MIKKIVLFLLVIFMVTYAYADKPTSYTDVKGIHLEVTFNIPVIEGETEQYIPARVTASCYATTSDGGKRRVHAVTELGNLADEPLTLRQLYNNIPAPLKSVFKDMVLEAIDEDVSQ